MSNLYRTIVRCVEKCDYELLDSIISVCPIDDIPTTGLISAVALLALVNTDIPSRNSFYGEVMELLTSRGVDTVSLKQEIEMGYCQ